MTYCFNPHCQYPKNHQGSTQCESCGCSLLLQNKYRGVIFLGQGGFGRTFLAVDKSQVNYRHCTIKQLIFATPSLDIKNKVSELFNQEIQRLQRLGNHPQIPELYDHFQQDGYHYLVQEYRPGENLDTVLEQEGKWNECQVRDLLEQLLPVLSYIHDRHVIHRDIKPANIIQGAKGDYSLVDFGSAKYVSETAFLRTGTTIGSPEYVAPEQMRGKAIYASDLYSLGITALHLLTQVSPFMLFDSAEAVWVWRDYLDNTQVSDRLAQILDRLIEPATKRRYQSAREVLRDLDPRRRVPPPPPPQHPFLPSSRSRIWRCVQTLEGHRGSVCALAISPDGRLLASGSFDGTIKLWNLQTGLLEETLQIHTKPVLTLAFSPNKHQLASGSVDDAIKLWDLTTRTVCCTPLDHYQAKVMVSVAYHPQGTAIASGGDDCRLHLWFIDSDRHSTINHPRGINTVAFSPNGEYLAYGSSDNQIYLLNIETGEAIAKLVGHQQDVNGISFSKNGKFLASGSSDLTVKLWDLEKLGSTQWLPQHTFQSHQDWVRAVAFSLDSQLLIAGSADGSLILWEMTTFGICQTLTQHLQDINAIALSPTDFLIASGSRDTTIKIWIGD